MRNMVYKAILNIKMNNQSEGKIYIGSIENQWKKRWYYHRLSLRHENHIMFISYLCKMNERIGTCPKLKWQIKKRECINIEGVEVNVGYVWRKKLHLLQFRDCDKMLNKTKINCCWMYVRAGRPAFAQPYVGVHKSTSLMSSSLLLHQCPACLVRLTWIVFVIGGRWPYSWCLVGCCRQDLFNIARSILV